MHQSINLLRSIYSFCIENALKIKEVRVRKRLSLHLCKKLQGKKVLLVGSGPSAKTLKDIIIPREYIILSVNLAPNNLPADTPLSIYITQSFAIEESSGAIDTILKTRTIETLLTNTKTTLTRSKNKDATCMIFNPRDTYYSRPTALTLRERYKLFQQGQHVFPSSGIQLLQYALAFGASEIYLIGIDSQEIVTYAEKSAYPERNTDEPKKNRHHVIDRGILKSHSKKYKNIYSIDESSSISKLFAVRQLS